jgi:hypothetical protein
MKSPVGRRSLVEPEPPDDKRDAERWRALCSSARIRVLSDTHQPHTHPVPDSKYINMEFWSDSETHSTYLALPALIAYVDHIRTRNKKR